MMVSLVRHAAAAYWAASSTLWRCSPTRRTALAIGFRTCSIGWSSLVVPVASASSTPTSLPSEQHQQQQGLTMTSHPGDCDASNSAAASVVATDFDTGYLNAADAAALDEELMSTPGFTLEQLMELAGLAVAEAVYQVLNEEEDDPQQTKGAVPSVEPQSQRILVICGPGNNGGDGLVAARHLVMFGYEATVVYPKRSRTQLHYANLVKQCQDLNIPVLDEMPDNWSSDHAVIVDAIFGFSFHGEPRPPFDRILEQLKSLSAMNDKILTVAVDVPSGWSVDGDDDGAVSETKFVPDVLVSLTAPKLCAQHFPGRHFVGGRFLPPALAAKYNVKMPPYHKTNQVMEISSRSSSNRSDRGRKNNVGWEASYAEYLAEKEAVADRSQEQPLAAEHTETWQVQYAAYCAEKEAELNQRE